MKKNKRGRPRVEVDWALVERLCSIQCMAVEIASALNISVDTLERRCKDDHGIILADYMLQKRGNGRIILRRLQFQAAQKGSIPMLIWLGKQYLGQRDKSNEEIEADREARLHTLFISSKDREEVSKMTTEELKRVYQQRLEASQAKQKPQDE